MILNFFFDLVEEKKLRQHFNEFMLSFHDFAHERKEINEENIINQFVKDLKSKTKLIYFDEFQVTNIVDAMILGHMEFDLYKDSLGKDKDGNDIYLKDIWPSNDEIENTLKQSLNAEMFIKRYSNVSEGPSQWQKIKTDHSSIYNWDKGSTYVKKPPFFDSLPDEPEGFKEIKDARSL